MTNPNGLIRREDAKEAAYESDSFELAVHGAKKIADRINAIPAAPEPPEVLALVEALRVLERKNRTQMRTASFHGGTCTCYRCAEDNVFAALAAWDACRKTSAVTSGPQSEYERKVSQMKEDFPNGI